MQQVLDGGVVVLDLTAPGVDPEFERKLGVGGADRFAAIAVGDDQYILSFSVDPVAQSEDLMASLGILRHAVDQKLRQERFVSVLNEARQIQMSILPRRSPRRGEFDIAGFTVPAEIVGGDFFDFIPVTDRIHGIAIATHRARLHADAGARRLHGSGWGSRANSRSGARSSGLNASFTSPH